ncbi:MAG TPA: abortive phage infection protein, partial [Gallicola sp.]|nr:abortive phage infection protein [Gallicola sp.]
SDDIYELGLTEAETPMGNKVRVYDIERCICDIIRSKNRMDSEFVKHSVREYIKRKDKDLIKLSKYADKMGIKKEVMDFMEVFYE